MKAPATVKGQRTRNAITAAAARLMHDRGVSATSLDDVLASSGAGKSQLYHYFRNKEELVAAVFEYEFERIMAVQPSLGDEGCTELVRWRAEVLGAHLESCFAGCPLGTFAGQVDGSDPLRSLFVELFDRWQSALAALVARAQRAGRIDFDGDPQDAALALLGALQGGTMLSHIQRDQYALKQMLDMALAGLGVESADGLMRRQP